MVDPKTIYGTNETQHIQYGEAKISIGIDGTVFVDYPNTPKIVSKFSQGKYYNSSRELVSDGTRYRAHYKKGELKGAIADAEVIL